MNILALILVAIGAFIFLLAHFRVPERFVTIALGLCFLSTGLIIQFVWDAHRVTAH